MPALPKSRTLAGSTSPPMPTPLTVQAPSPVCSTVAPRAFTAAAVHSTSSPSSRRVICVSPTLRSAKISARCEMDLSPGMATRPRRGGEARDDKGEGLEWDDTTTEISMRWNLRASLRPTHRALPITGLCNRHPEGASRGLFRTLLR
ncbi:hypothetical protein CHELA20_52787 [Hyphomicrobiales bacterium]|nr:hypothetical protein CHELA41_22138 [Hyphomicrobiales bacterium]CAH1682919.1 hypothetical protein CHELA20_52787 [Hyphomicrobiales bacterium]